jgi:hypothetical protein
MTKRKREKFKTDLWFISFLVIIGFLGIFLIILLLPSFTKPKIQETSLKSTETSLSEGEIISPELWARLRKTGVERYFLSEVAKRDNYFVPLVHDCLFQNGKPLYPSYLYGSWEILYFPKDPPYQIALVRYLLLPEDNPSFKLDKSCFIKEIKTEEDWKEVEKKYGFLKIQFSKVQER